MSTLTKTDMVVASKYKLMKKVGSGAFGEIYKASNINGGDEVAVKLEPCKSKFPQLYYEAKLYKIFDGAGKYSFQIYLIVGIFNIVGVPKIYHFGREGDYNVMVIDMLGPSLEDLFEYCRRKFTLKTVLMLAIQML